MTQANETGNRKSSTTIYPSRKSPEGHEGPLAAMIKNKNRAVIALVGGVSVTGVVCGFDRFTISIVPDGDSFPTTYFKHGVLSFTRAW